MGSGSSGKPIIVVPAADVKGNISLKNTKMFLEGGKYLETECEEIKKILSAQNETEKYENKKTMTRKIGNDLVTFEIYDSTYGFTKKEWRRVVCLFTNGEPFQLKDWPPKENESTEQEKSQKVVNLFHRVKGFYLHYQDVIEHPVVKSWNVTRLIIQRNKRHQDINLQNTIWKELEAFLRKEKFKDSTF